MITRQIKIKPRKNAFPIINLAKEMFAQGICIEDTEDLGEHGHMLQIKGDHSFKRDVLPVICGKGYTLTREKIMPNRENKLSKDSSEIYCNDMPPVRPMKPFEIMRREF